MNCLCLTLIALYCADCTIAQDNKLLRCSVIQHFRVIFSFLGINREMQLPRQICTIPCLQQTPTLGCVTIVPQLQPERTSDSQLSRFHTCGTILPLSNVKRGSIKIHPGRMQNSSKQIPVALQVELAVKYYQLTPRHGDYVNLQLTG